MEFLTPTPCSVWTDCLTQQFYCVAKDKGVQKGFRQSTRSWEVQGRQHSNTFRKDTTKRDKPPANRSLTQGGRTWGWNSCPVTFSVPPLDVFGPSSSRRLWWKEGKKTEGPVAGEHGRCRGLGPFYTFVRWVVEVKSHLGKSHDPIVPLTDLSNQCIHFCITKWFEVPVTIWYCNTNNL